MLLITSGMMWRDMDPIQLVNKFYSCYIANVVGIVNGCGLGIEHVVETSLIRVSYCCIQYKPRCTEDHTDTFYKGIYLLKVFE